MCCENIVVKAGGYLELSANLLHTFHLLKCSVAQLTQATEVDKAVNNLCASMCATSKIVYIMKLF